MKALLDVLPRHAPPLWMVLAASLVLAAGLLSVFIDLLHDHLRHSAELRAVMRQPAQAAVTTVRRVAEANTATPQAR